MSEYESDSDSSDVACPWEGCDRVFDSEVALKSHHFGAHGERLGSVQIPCSYCGTPKTVKKSRAGKHDRHFCDDECQGNWRSENWVGEENTNYDRVEVQCEVCGKPKPVKPSIAAARERFFCDDDCMGHYHAQITGKDNPNWKGGSPQYYGANWQEQREKAREHDGYQCQSCGMTDGEHKKQYGEQLHVHHIRPIRLYDTLEEANVLRNLVTLCSSCHARYEGIPLRPQLTD